VSPVIVDFPTAGSFALVVLASLLLLIYIMLMARSLALLLFLAVADRPDVAGTVFVTVVAGLPSVFDVLMFLIAIVTCNPVHASVPACCAVTTVHAVACW
jgi:hypothetical protein